MKIRIMGTPEELKSAETYYKALRKQDYVNYVEISKPYPNRNGSQLSRLYVEVICKDCTPNSLLIKSE